MPVQLHSKFQAFKTLFENTFAQTFNFDRFLLLFFFCFFFWKSFRPLLRVDISTLTNFIAWRYITYRRDVRVKSGIYGQTAKFGQRPCLFHISNIRIKKD